MLWETKMTFNGEVKTAGIQRAMAWKKGSVRFDCDKVSGSWMAKLYFNVNPNKIIHEMKIGKSVDLSLKCGRLMIENKKGDGIHIKFPKKDHQDAELLISAIKKSLAQAPNINKAEVTVGPLLSSHRSSENIRPVIKDDFQHLSLFQSLKKSPYESHNIFERQSPGNRSMHNCIAPKRKLELSPPQKDKQENNMIGDRVFAQQKFTGNSPRDNVLQTSNGLPAKNFYRTDVFVPANRNIYRNNLANNSLSWDRSPELKKQRLSSFGPVNFDNKMADSYQSSFGENIKHANITRKHFGADETVGFQNLGNTCFLNSPLQCLSYLEPLCLDIQSVMADYGPDINKNSVTRKLYLLMTDVRKDDVCPERVREILTRLRADMNVKFAPNTQQDAHELISELLSRLDEEVKSAIRHHASTRSPTPAIGLATDPERVQTPSPSGDGGDVGEIILPNANISTPTENNFCWSYRTCIYFHECKHEMISSQTNSETTLMLAFDSNTKNLQDCIDKYFESTDVEMKCENCGKDEKATITRKIVRRPRVFILNLLRYHTDNTSSSKKADHVGVPSHITVVDYCASDVQQPPSLDAAFMMNRFKSPNSQKSIIKGKSMKHDTPDCKRSERTESGSSTDSGNGLDSFADNCEWLSDLVDHLTSSLRNLDKFVEHAQEDGQDITILYAGAQEVISELKMLTLADHRVVNQPGGDKLKKTLLLEFLLKKMLNLQDTEGVTAEMFQKVIEELIVTRYEHMGERDRSVDHLIDDLGMCVSARQSGVLQPAAWVLPASFKKQKQGDGNLSQTVKKNESPQVTADGDGARKGSRLRRTVAFRNAFDDFFNMDVDVSDASSNEDNTSVIKEHATKKHSKKSSLNVKEFLKDDSFEESENTNPTSKTELPDRPESPRQMLQGRDINLFTEADLQQINFETLTDDEMMIYAQALSKLEYEKQQESHETDMNVLDVTMEIRTSSPTPDTGGSIGLTDTKSSCGDLARELNVGAAKIHDMDKTDPNCSDEANSSLLCHEDPLYSPEKPGRECVICGGICSCEQLVQGTVNQTGLVAPHLVKMSYDLSPEMQKLSTSHEEPVSTGQPDTLRHSSSESEGNDQLAVSGAQSEFVFSQSRNNYLLKTRDYARLKSPALSPKKRSGKGHQPKCGSVPKRLHFNKGQGEITDKVSPDGDDSSDPHNSSLEVNVDDDTSLDVIIDESSFYDNINSSILEPSPASHFATPSSTSKSKNSVSRHASSRMSPEESSHQPSGHVVSQHVETSPGLRKTSENIEPGIAAKIGPKTNRLSITDVLDTEEKENIQNDMTESSLMDLSKTQLLYKLVGVVDHVGTSQFTGHYTAYSFNMRKQKWFHLNDSETKMVTEEEVRDKNSQTGYLFFYMDRDLFQDYRNKAHEASSL